MANLVRHIAAKAELVTAYSRKIKRVLLYYSTPYLHNYYVHIRRYCNLR